MTCIYYIIIVMMMDGNKNPTTMEEKKMETKITHASPAGIPWVIEDDRWRWTSNDEYMVFDKAAGRMVYRGAYLRTTRSGSDPCPADVLEESKKFLTAARELHAKIKSEVEKRAEEKERAEYEKAKLRRIPQTRAYELLQSEGYCDEPDY